MPSLSLISSLMLVAAPTPADPGAVSASSDERPPQASKPGPQEAPRRTVRPIVHVVADDALIPWLRERLFEDGYPLNGSPAAASVQLTVVRNLEGNWDVIAQGQSTVTFVVEGATDFAVVRLELLHRCIDALEDVAPAAASEDPTRVGLTVSEVSSALLPSDVAAGVLAAGATLVPSGEPAQLRVCAAPGPQGDPHVSVIAGEEACSDPSAPAVVESDSVPLRATTSSTSFMVAAAMEMLAGSDVAAETDVADEAGHQEAALVAGPWAEEDFERAPGLEAAPRQSRTPLRGASFVVRGGAAAGAVVRSSAVDPLVAAWMTVGREPGLQGWAEMQVRPATVVGDFRVVEIVPAIGFKLRPLTVRRFSLEAGALLGAEIHNYRVLASQQSDRGTHLAATGEAALGFAVAVWKKHELHFALRLGRGSERIHRFDGKEIWRRGGGRVGATVGFSFGGEPNS